MSVLTRLSLANRGLVALIALVITGFGIYAIPSLKQQLLPSLEFPGAFIGASVPGASPEIIEAQVTKPIEDAVKGADGLDKVESTTREGAATISVTFEFGTDIDEAVNQLTTAINRIQPTLPTGVTPTVFAGSTDDIPAIVLAASGGGDQAALAEKLNDTVVPDLIAIAGVRDVQVTGVRDEQIVITPDLPKMAQRGVQPTALTEVLKANGISIPAGAVAEGDKSLSVQVGTPITGLDQLKNLYLAGRAAPVKLSDVAKVESKPAAPTGYTRTDGVESLGIAVTASPDGNPVAISTEVNEKLAALESASGAKLTVIVDQAPFVQRSIKSLTTEGLLGLLMAVIVILVFLLSIRSTLVTAVSIPLSVLIALIGLWIGDYSLNLLTLGALTIAVGRVVDDSIVVLENIKRHLGYGEEKKHAIVSGVREVAGAVTASTLTTVAVFAPIALVGGFVGQLFAPFAVTVTVALIASLFVSLTVVPVLAYWFLRPAAGGVETEEVRKAAEEKERRSPLQRTYLPVIRFATKRRWLTVLIGILILAGTSGLATRLQTNFLDESGQDSISISQQLPVGTNLATVDAAAKKVEEALRGRDGVKSYQVTVGQSGEFNPFVGSGGASGASFSVALEEDADAVKIGNDLRDQLGKLNGIGEITVGADSSTGLSGDQLAVTVQASDNAVLATATEQVKTALAATPDTADVKTSLAASVPRLQVAVDRAKAAAAGLTEGQIGQTVAGAFRPAPAGQVSVDGASRDVVISFGTPPTSAAALRKLPLTTARGVVPLSSVAKVSQVDGPEEVTRVDGNRSVSVTGTYTGKSLTTTTNDLKKRLAALDLQAGASYSIGGVSQDQADAFRQLGLAVLAAIAIVFVIMVATFRSIVQPIILLISIPFAATGAIALLLATGTPLGVPALIGVLMLVGIVVTNAIVLLDLINHYRREGMGVVEAVVEGGRHRVRPILMTAIATIFALLPMALGLTGEGGFISKPLAVVVIGGLVSSTLLTLVLVPTLYTMVENRKEKSKAKRERKRLAKVPAPPRHAAPEEAPDDVPQEDAPQVDAPQVDAPQVDAPQVDAPQDDAPKEKGDAPKEKGDAPKEKGVPKEKGDVPKEKGDVPKEEPEKVSGALRGYTDQFEVLKMPPKPAAPPTA